jgi:hypothetical protein
MSRRPLVLVALSLATLTLAACSDITAPTSQGKLKPGAAVNTGSSSGGTLLSSGRSN